MPSDARSADQNSEENCKSARTAAFPLYKRRGADGVYLKAVEAGCDGIDTALSPLAMGTSQPATEVMYKTLQAAGVKVELNEDSMALAYGLFPGFFRADVSTKNGMLDVKMMDVDTDTLRYQVPGWNAFQPVFADRKNSIWRKGCRRRSMKEVPRVREDLRRAASCDAVIADSRHAGRIQMSCPASATR